MFFLTGESILYKATEEKVKALIHKWVGNEIGGLPGRNIEIFSQPFLTSFSHINVLLLLKVSESNKFLINFLLQIVSKNYQ